MQHVTISNLRQTHQHTSNSPFELRSVRLIIWILYFPTFGQLIRRALEFFRWFGCIALLGWIEIAFSLSFFAKKHDFLQIEMIFEPRTFKVQENLTRLHSFLFVLSIVPSGFIRRMQLMHSIIICKGLLSLFFSSVLFFQSKLELISLVHTHAC